jgi:hypothetical protein
MVRWRMRPFVRVMMVLDFSHLFRSKALVCGLLPYLYCVRADRTVPKCSPRRQTGASGQLPRL